MYGVDYVFEFLLRESCQAVCVYIYIYLFRERERDQRQRDVYVCLQLLCTGIVVVVTFLTPSLLSAWVLWILNQNRDQVWVWSWWWYVRVSIKCWHFGKAFMPPFPPSLSLPRPLVFVTLSSSVPSHSWHDEAS